MPNLVPSRDVRSVTLGDGRIIVLGGSELNQTSVFDPVAITVSRLTARFPSARMSGAAALGADGRVYYVGGFTIESGVAMGPLTESYALDVASGALTSIAPLPEHRAWFALVARPGGRLTAIGGYNRTGDVRSVLASTVTYTIATNTWR
jgi:hypothetical protein